MTYAGVLRDELNDLIEKNRDHGEMEDIPFLYTYFMLRQEWVSNRVMSVFNMTRNQIRTKDHKVIYLDELKIDNKHFTIIISQHTRDGSWAGGLFVVRLTMKEGRRISRVYGDELEVIVNSLDDLILGIDEAINGDLGILKTLLICCAEGERRKEFYYRARHGWSYPARLGMNKIDSWSYMIKGEEEKMSDLSDLEWDLAGVMIRKDDWSLNEAVVTARSMVRNLGEDECRNILAGEFKTLRHRCIDVRFHEVNNEHGFNDNDLDAAESDESPLSSIVLE